MWKFVQRTGNLYHDDKLVSTGYAGRGDGKNNPAMQDQHNKGPLPVGLYTIGTAYNHPHLGPVTMNLEPDADNEMYGRSAFRIHADSIAHPGDASDGCVVQNRTLRIMVSSSPDRRLEVVSEEA